MRGVVIAVAIGKRRNGEFVVDPEEGELSGIAGSGCFALIFGAGVGGGKGLADEGRPVWSTWQGAPLTESEVDSVSNMAQKATNEILQIIRRRLSGSQSRGEELSGIGEEDVEMT